MLMATLSKAKTVHPVAAKVKKINATIMQRVLARRIGEILEDADVAIAEVKKQLQSHEISASFAKTIRKKGLSEEDLIELLALTLSQKEYESKENSVRAQTLQRIRSEHVWLEWVSAEIHSGGRTPSTYLQAEALEFARQHYQEFGKYLSAAKIHAAVCRNAFSNDIQSYIFEIEKKKGTQLPFAVRANPHWMEIKKNYGQPVSVATVGVWLRQACLIGPSKKKSSN
jgi:hypothetical protein